MYKKKPVFSIDACSCAGRLPGPKLCKCESGQHRGQTCVLRLSSLGKLRLKKKTTTTAVTENRVGMVDCGDAVERGDVMLVVWDILSHMVSISVGRCLGSCIRVDWPDLKILQGSHLQMHDDHWPNEWFGLGQISVQIRASLDVCVHIWVSVCILVSAYLCLGLPQILYMLL